MLTTDATKSWTLPEKIIFRFLFIFLGYFLLDYEFGLTLVDLGFFKTLTIIFGAMSPPLFWIDQHLFHIGYNPDIHQSFPGDSYFGAVYTLSIITLTVIIVIIWSVLDRRRKNYHQLNYWFRLYIRYIVALVVFSYGMEKVIPVQMSYPGITDLLTPMGDETRFNVVWNFIGASPGYEKFTGICEVTASLLLLFNRTYVFGSLVMCTILTNVVALNHFYNIGVVFYSSLLLSSTLYLLLPFLSRFFRLLFRGDAVTLTEKHYRFERSWKKYLVLMLGVAIPLCSCINSIYSSQTYYNKVQAQAKDQKLYNVTSFVAKDTLPALLTDTLRWRRFAFISNKNAAVYSMQDKSSEYDCDIDSVKHTCRLHDNDDSTKWDIMHYSYPQKDMLQFSGSWKGTDVHILMKEVPIDSMQLNKEKLKFLQD